MSEISIIEKTFFAICRTWGNLNASYSAIGSIQSMSSGIDSADLNMVWTEKPLAPADADTLDLVKRNFQSKGLPFWFWVFPSAKTASTLDILKAAGLSLVTSTPCMLIDLELISEKAPEATAINVRRIENKKDLELWRDVSFAGFDFPQETFAQYDRFTESFSLHAECPHRLFLAFAEGRPVATSILLLTENTAGIYFVSTLAEYRNKGIGLEQTQATLHYAKTAGARFATLQSSPDGLHVYERAGFKEYCRVDVYSLQNRHRT